MKKEDLIIQKLDEIHQDVKRINEEKLPKLDKKIAVVETKVKVYSTIAAFVGGFLAHSARKMGL